jgi:hypothetical protein
MSNVNIYSKTYGYVGLWNGHRQIKNSIINKTTMMDICDYYKKGNEILFYATGKDMPKNIRASLRRNMRKIKPHIPVHKLKTSTIIIDRNGTHINE